MNDRTGSPPAKSALSDFGDDDATRWSNIANRFDTPLRGFFAKRVGNAADVDDLVQEVFVRLMRRGGRRPIDQIEKYLFQSAANVLRDYHRRRAVRAHDSHRSYEDDVHGDSEISPERVLLGRDAILQIRIVLERLPERTRDVFVLRAFEGKRSVEIARLMGVSVRSVEKHMARAMALVESVLRDDE